MLIGVDLGGTNIACGLVDDDGTICMRSGVPTDARRGAEAVMADIVAQIEWLIAQNPTGKAVDAIGIGIPGIADPRTGVVISCVNLHWERVALRDYLAARISSPIFIDNDATVAGVAEFEVAQGGVYDDAVLITLGTGIGGGVRIGGKSISGHHGIGSEVGHMLVGEGLYTCNCGRNGCLETFASATAIRRYAAHLIEREGTDTLMLEMAGGDVEGIDGELIFKASERGDAMAKRVIDRMVDYLARGIMNIVCTIDPEIVLIGGGLSMAGEALLTPLRARLETLHYFPGAPPVRVEIAKLKNDAGIIGAALYAKQQVLNGGRIYESDTI